jgi:hypothetical protein
MKQNASFQIHTTVSHPSLFNLVSFQYLQQDWPRSCLRSAIYVQQCFTCAAAPSDATLSDPRTVAIATALSVTLSNHSTKSINNTSVAHPDPGSGAFLTPGSGIQDG